MLLLDSPVRTTTDRGSFLVLLLYDAPNTHLAESLLFLHADLPLQCIQTEWSTLVLALILPHSLTLGMHRR